MLHGPKTTQKQAARLRRQMSLPEVLLWAELRKRPAGYKFRRQHPAGRYILDFYCAGVKLAIEVDGLAHDMRGRPERDRVRDAWLVGFDVKVLRIPATDILQRLSVVVDQIVAACVARDPSTTCGGPPPHAGEDP